MTLSAIGRVASTAAENEAASRALGRRRYAPAEIRWPQALLTER